MKSKKDKLNKARDGSQDDLQQRIAALQKENIKLKKENTKLTFDTRKLILDLKQHKLDFSALQMTHEEKEMKCAGKIRTLENEIVEAKKTRPTAKELLESGCKQLRKVYPKEAFYDYEQSDKDE